MSNSIAITGVSGHLGFALLKAAIQRKELTHIYGTVKSKESLERVQQFIDGLKLLNKKITIYQLDLDDKNITKSNFFRNKVDYLIHNAAILGTVAKNIDDNRSQEGDAYGKSGFYNSNVAGTAKIYESFSLHQHSLKKVIYISSGDIYDPSKTNSEKSLPLPANTYGISKYMGEVLTNIFSQKENIKSLILRAGSIYGPGQIQMKGVKKMIEDAVNNQEINIYGNGTQKRNFIYVMDIANVAIELLSKNIDAPIVNLASMSVSSISTIARLVASCLPKEKIKINYINKQTSFKDYILDVGILESLDLGVSTSIEEGIKKQFLHHLGDDDQTSLYKAL